MYIIIQSRKQPERIINFSGHPARNLTNMTFVNMQLLELVAVAVKLLTSTVVSSAPSAVQVLLQTDY